MTTDNSDTTDDGALDRMRDAPVGTNDPNIVGDVGPTDIPPGQDPLSRTAMEDPPTDDSPSLDTMEGSTTYGQPAEPAT
jgi:hypothetical protein